MFRYRVMYDFGVDYCYKKGSIVEFDKATGDIFTRTGALQPIGPVADLPEADLTPDPPVNSSTPDPPVNSSTPDPPANPSVPQSTRKSRNAKR